MGAKQTAVGKGQGLQTADEGSIEVAQKQEPRCLAIAKRGVRTGGQFAEMMSALMSDLVEGNVTPQIGNATCNAGGKLLKVVEMQLKYGVVQSDGRQKTLNLVLSEEVSEKK